MRSPTQAPTHALTRAPLVACIRALAGLAVLAAGCSVQLVPPYDAQIAQEASSLQKDFYVFVGTMQTEAATPAGYYGEHVKDYVEFEARLAALRSAAEGQPGGVPCPLGANQTAGLAPAVRQQLQGGSATCIAVLAQIAERQMERLRQAHEIACKPLGAGSLGRPDPQCQALFGDPPLYRTISGQPSSAPLVTAVSISLNELAQAERSLKPASGS